MGIRFLSENNASTESAIKPNVQDGRNLEHWLFLDWLNRTSTVKGGAPKGTGTARVEGHKVDLWLHPSAGDRCNVSDLCMLIWLVIHCLWHDSLFLHEYYL
jgi:hypothetical protein